MRRSPTYLAGVGEIRRTPYRRLDRPDAVGFPHLASGGYA